MNKESEIKTWPGRHHFVGLLCASAAWWLMLLSGLGATSLPFVVNVVVDKPMQYLPTNGSSSKANLSATVTAPDSILPPSGGSYTYAWVQLQDGLNPLAVNIATNGKASISNAASAACSVSLPIPGVYEFQVTVTDSKNSANTAIRRTWINIWNPKPALGSDPLSVIPGVAAPTFVQSIPSDPGPYQHPRLLCTPSQQPALKAKVTGGSALASQAYFALVAQTVPQINSSSITADLLSFMGAADIAAISKAPYAETYSGSTKTLTSDISNLAYENYYTLLGNAAYAAWVNPAGTTLNLQAVANLSAALAHFHLIQCYNESTGAFNTSSPAFITGLQNIGVQSTDDSGDICYGLALAYDFAYNAMLPSQQEDIRKMLFAVGYNRTTSAIYLRGYDQNGDFSNLGDFRVFLSLAIDGETEMVKALDPQIFNQFTTPVSTAPWILPPASALPTDSRTWPFSTAANVGDLQREIWWAMDFNVSPWGWTNTREDYYGLSTLYTYPAAFALAIHGGENQYVTTNIFGTKELIVWDLYAGDKGLVVPAFGPDNIIPSFPVNQYLYDHHDSGALDYRQLHVIFLKYMYPNDLAIDYIYRQNLGGVIGTGTNMQAPFWYAIFGLDPIGLVPGTGTPTTLAQAAAKEEQNAPVGLAQPNGQLIKVDPQMGATVVRSGWDENDTELFFDTSWQDSAHWHDEQNSFTFYALGRAWAFAPGRHVTMSDAQSSVLIQDPTYAGDLATSGYRGGSISSVTQNTEFNAFPPSPGKLINVTEDPNHVFATMMGDATHSYIWANCKKSTPSSDSGSTRADFMPNNLYGYLRSLIGGVNPADANGTASFLGKNNGHLMRTQIRPGFVQARRSIIFVRTPSPYAMVIDDYNTDNKVHNYRWVMNSAEGFAAGQTPECIDADGKEAAASVTLLPGTATTSQAVFYHPVDKDSGPRLLIKDCTEAIQGMTVPVITLEAKNNITDINTLNKLPAIPTSTQYLTEGGIGAAGDYPYVNTNRVIIDHNKVIKPQFKVLLFPFTAPAGATTFSRETPTTSTVVNGNITTITIKNPASSNGTAGPVDTITLDANNLNTNPAKYITFARASAAAKPPTITLPTNANLSVGYGKAVDYSGITATSSTGASLTVTYSIPNGTVFSPGVTTVTASVLDPATGLETSQVFTVAVAPAPPAIAFQSIYNLNPSGSDNGISLSWPPVAGATSYNVYRGTAANGPFAIVSGHLAPATSSGSSISELTFFNDRNLKGTSYFYQVTAVVTDSVGTDHEGAPSNIISLTQPVPSSLGLTVQGIGNNSSPNSGCGFAPLTTAPFSFLMSQSNVITVASNGKGYGFGSGGDEGYNFLGKTWTGDGTFTVRVKKTYANFGASTNPSTVNNTDYTSLYGLIFRDNAPTNNQGQVAEAGTYYSTNPGQSSSGVTSYNRTVVVGNSKSTRAAVQQGNFSTPLWLRLSRMGTTFTSSCSLDGQNWVTGAPTTVGMSSTNQVGVNIAANGNANQDNATFDNLVFLSPPAITIGNGSLSLDWSQSTGAISYFLTRSSSPSGPFTAVPGETAVTTTKFTDNALTNLATYYYQLSAVDASGVVTTVAPVAGTPAAYGTTLVTATPGDRSVTLNWNSVPNASIYKVYENSGPTSGPYTLISTGNTTATFSSLTNGTPYYFFVVAGNGTVVGSDSPTVAAVPESWIDQNIGTVLTLGTYSASNGVLNVTGNGSDVTANNSDEFNYLYRPWIGDGTFIAHIASITTTDTSSAKTAKVGVMFRAAPATISATNAANAFVVDSLNGSSSFQNRNTLGGGTNGNGTSSLGPPNWLRLERSGNNFTAFTSQDEVSWQQFGGSNASAITDTIGDPGLIGLAVNARNKNALCTAMFDATAFLVIPQNLAASNVQGTHLSLGWTINPRGNMTDATALQVEVSPIGMNVWTVLASNLSPQMNTYPVTGLNPSTSYDFRVKELGGPVAGDYAVLSGVKTSVADLPISPINLSAIVQGGTSVKLGWTNQVTNAVNNVVAFRTTGTTKWTSYASTLSPTTTSEIVQGLVEGKTYDFEVYATNVAGASASPPIVTITLPAAGSFALWAASYGLAGDNATPSATPAGDGVSNSLKYLIGVNPMVPITSTNRNFLPTLGTATLKGVNYLTLTYRQSTAGTTGISALLQTSPNLMNWTIVSPPDFYSVLGTDPGSNDPIIQVGAKIVGTRQFVRLELVTP